MHLERYLQRLSEIQEELGEIGEDLQASTGGEGEETNPSGGMPQVRIAGFRAYHLAQEGMALLNLVAVSLAMVRATADESDSQEQIQKLDTVNHYLDELEPILKRILKDMEPYRSLEPVES
jgi:hypothetical protein